MRAQLIPSPSPSPSRFYRRKEDPKFTFDQVSAVVRLAHKYKVDDVKAHGLHLLQETHFNTDWDVWEIRSLLKPALTVRGSFAIGAVNLARQIGATSILPIALYGCTMLDGAVLDGWRRDDGVVEHLTEEDLALCMRGRDALVREAAALCARVFSTTPCEECTSSKCRSRLRTVRMYALVEEFPGHLVLDLGWVPRLERGFRVCEPCSEAVSTHLSEERYRVWCELPDIFGIEVEEWP